MHCDPQKFSIKSLVSAWNKRSLSANLEYQRGASWTTSQKQGLIDSLFRSYPIPRLFLHKISEMGLDGTEAVRFEIVDGQQRIRAFAEYLGDEFELLKPEDKQLRLPNSLRKVPAQWAGKRYSQLDDAQRILLDSSEIDAFVITKTDNPDEIRDLFIRLQSGTALNRQQVRDAWPGALGPYIETLGGKMRKEPASALFGLVDRRSDRGDDDDDRFTVNRTVCAQLFALYQARLRDSLAAQSIAADDLDRLYHANTDFQVAGPTAEGFKKTLDLSTAVFLIASGGGEVTGRTRRKFKKLDVISVFMLMQDLSANPLWKSNIDVFKQVSDHVCAASASKSGKSTSGRSINAYYQEWRDLLPGKLGIHLDSQRLFDETQKQIIYERDGGKCSLCSSPVAQGDGEYDHYPIPHYLGGKTILENGRLVCTKCHPRGRPAADA